MATSIFEQDPAAPAGDHDRHRTLVEAIDQVLRDRGAVRRRRPCGRLPVPGGQPALRRGDRTARRRRPAHARAGAGIPAEHLRAIFDLSTQLHRERDGAQPGLGIGLSLVRSLVQRHGGEVEARSEGPGRGAEFVVRRPLRSGTAC